jgi:hypothetical protein
MAQHYLRRQFPDNTLVTLVIGMFIGWNMPQPDWARAMQGKVVQLLDSVIRK